ncbi:hypothetical protein [Streptococcus cristatus]|uniref:Uncharacterized protein n=1 Tax=Streptococcus cristatus TaxID=45634 RepID=A0A139N5M4_STRCR|nr:hypothetical protein [Streptococcus cristatus]KXT71339.1 hypothetical protein SCRDD08_00119 [Streptococcus cristatus]
MAIKRIQPMRIQSIKASINASTEEISQGMKSIIEAPVTDSLESCAGLAKTCMENLVETVDSLDLFMNNIAQAFQNMDTDLAGSIQSNDMYSISPQKHTESQRIQQKIYDASIYKELP